MFINDLPYIFSWWFVLFILGIIFLPLTNFICRSFFDKGYAFAKILGLLLVGFTVWLLASLKIFPFALPTILGVLLIFFLINLKIFKSFKLLKIYFLEEALFLAGFIFWAFVKAHESSIHGLEKFMDFGFINSILRSEYFPPKDLWLSPESINYYYFGHYLAALMIKFTNTLPEIGYNLTLSALFGLCLSASFSIGSNLYYFFLSHKPQAISYKPLAISGFLSAFLVTLGGNLQTIYAFFKNYQPADHAVPFWQLPLQWNWDGYWYPNATRFIPFTIHEFPIYSFVVSDLHGHVFDIPFVLLIIAILMVIYFSSKLPTTSYLLLALLVAVFLMTNVLDGPIYLLVIFIVLLAKQISLPSTIYHLQLKHLAVAGRQLAVVLFFTIIFSLPFWLSFKPFSSGIGVLCAPQFLIDAGKLGPFLFEANHCARSPLWMLLILWGFPLFVVSLFVRFILFDQYKKRHEIIPIDFLVFILSLAAFILILIPEFFYAKDIYPAHYRANTVFKFGYQAFIILGLTSGYMITRLISNFKFQISHFVLCTLYFVLFFLVAIYPYFAINSYFGGLRNYQGLDGLNYLSDLYPDDYQALHWINQNISGQPVILEAQGDSYTDFARISSNTGLPTVIGWPVHEWLWRGSYDEAGKRSGEVTTLYESPDLKLTQDLLEKYKVQYVFIGILERQKYKNLNEEKFAKLGKIIYQNGITKIYQLYST